MSIVEYEIKNPKKQLEFYKELTEQLQNQVEKLTQENNDLEELLNKQYQDGYIQGKFNNEMKVLELQSVIDKATKRLKGLQAINNGLGATIAPYSLNDVIKILDGSLEEILRSKE